MVLTSYNFISTLVRQRALQSYYVLYLHYNCFVYSLLLFFTLKQCINYGKQTFVWFCYLVVFIGISIYHFLQTATSFTCVLL